MKKKILQPLAAAFLLTFLSACLCKKGPQPIPALKVKYPNVSATSQLLAIRTAPNNISTILDTITIAELNSSNGFSAVIQFEENSPNYILFIDGTAYNDTITDVSYELNDKGCKYEIVNFKYKLNGVYRTDLETEIH